MSNKGEKAAVEGGSATGASTPDLAAVQAVLQSTFFLSLATFASKSSAPAYSFWTSALQLQNEKLAKYQEIRCSLCRSLAL
jgi:hypothetical protein